MIIDDIRNGQNGNQQAVMDLVNKFSPALKKYARKLETEDAYFDLQAEFLDLILHLNCDKMRETGDGAMVQYLSQSIYHAYIKLLRQLIDNKMPCISTDNLTDGILYQNHCVVGLKEFTGYSLHASFGVRSRCLFPNLHCWLLCGRARSFKRGFQAKC